MVSISIISVAFSRTMCYYLSMNARKPNLKNSLGYLYPLLVKEWSANNERTPLEVYPKSHAKYLWICDKHGEYEMSCAHKSEGKGCPWCSGQSRKPYPGQSLGDLYPEISLELSELDPMDLYPHSSKKVLWTCPNGHGDYLKPVKNRTLRGYGCPKCSHKVGDVDLKESLAYLYPDIAATWSPNNTKSPWEVYPGSHYKASWSCTIHGEYLMFCYSRTRGSGCPECGRIKVGKLRKIPSLGQSLGDLHPELIDEWSNKNSRSPFEVRSGSHYKAIWVCSKHGEYTMACRSHVRGYGCSQCGKDRSSTIRSTPPKGKSLAELYPKIIREWSTKNDKTPFEVYPGSRYKAEWVCSKGHKWEAHIYSRTGKVRTECPRCSNNQISRAEDLLRDSLVSSGALPDQVKLSGWTVDIYFPESKTVVEYDGSYFHSFEGCWERDMRKSLELLEEGYTVIRVRTYSSIYVLESLGIKDSNYFEVFCKEPKDSVPSEELVDEIKTILEFDKGGYLL